MKIGQAKLSERSAQRSGLFGTPKGLQFVSDLGVDDLHPSLKDILIDKSITDMGFPNGFGLQNFSVLPLLDESVEHAQIIHLVDQYGSDDDSFLVEANLTIDISLFILFN